MIANRDLYFACIYSGLNSRYLSESEWKNWADLLLELSLVPKKWVIELANFSFYNENKLNEELFNEMHLNSTSNEMLFQCLHEMIFSFVYIKSFLNGGGDENEFLNALEEMGFSEGMSFNEIKKLAGKNLDVCLNFSNSMNDVDFLRKNKWIYEQN
ncbi:hypothetical protein D3C72_930190 [compost metagenome]